MSVVLVSWSAPNLALPYARDPIDASEVLEGLKLDIPECLWELDFDREATSLDALGRWASVADIQNFEWKC